MPDDARAIETLPAVSSEAQLQDEDTKIERTAVALCWAGRPALPATTTPREWWWRQSEVTQRVHLYRARVAVTAWENTDAV